jgi:hypothetical protein
MGLYQGWVNEYCGTILKFHKFYLSGKIMKIISVFPIKTDFRKGLFAEVTFTFW